MHTQTGEIDTLENFRRRLSPEEIRQHIRPMKLPMTRQQRRSMKGKTYARSAANHGKNATRSKRVSNFRPTLKENKQMNKGRKKAKHPIPPAWVDNLRIVLCKGIIKAAAKDVATLKAYDIQTKMLMVLTKAYGLKMRTSR